MFSKALNFIKSNSTKDWFCLLFIGLFAALIIFPLTFFGVPLGYDLEQHFRFGETFHKAILSGDLFPGWAAESNMGFGSIGIRYYPPIAYYLMAFTQMFTHDWYDTFWINCFFWMFLGGIGVYFLAREWSSAGPSLFTAIFFSFVPYHCAQIYQYILYAEFAAAGIIPFCFLFATRIVKRGRYIDVFLFSISYSLLLLTHIPSTVVGSIGLAVYVFLLIDWKQPRKPVFNFLIAFGLSLSAAAFHWLRIVTEINWVGVNSPKYFSSGYYDYKNNFFPMIYNTPANIYKLRGSWHGDITTIFSILLFLPLIIYLILQLRSNNAPPQTNRKIIYTLSITGLFSIFMASEPSLFIWNSLTFLQKIQFPTRFLSVTSVIGAVAFTLGVTLLISQYSRLRKVISYAALLIILSILFFDISQSILPAGFVPRDEFEIKTAKFLSEPDYDYWWTIWAKSEAFERPEKVYAGDRTVDITRWDGELREFTIDEGSPTNIRIATFYHPYWKAEVNNTPVEIQKDDDGTILIPVSEGKSSIKLYFQEPLKLNVALIISILTWIFLLGASFAAYRSRRKIQTNLIAED